ncbi:MAG: YbaB/EbfC family nucleoid-associated protein [Gammaproteobacteria bacterium]|nr:YbaB/EbfC family nucleoid-associated protein [Gammaproteobacteria bacterium]MBT8443916.1 YbaB/EbfC family nucleoid-associated protein [Gammaproteobacteria bacterium]
MKGELGQLMQQAQKMQEQMQKAQEELASLEVTGEAGGGLARVTMTGKHEVRKIDIDDTLIGDDREMLEDVLAAAFNDALRKVEKTVADKYSGMAGGLGLPAGLKLPF